MIENLIEFYSNTLGKFSFSDLMQNSHWIDWVLLFFIVLGIVYGASKGLWREFVKFIEILIVIIIVMELQPQVAYYLTSVFKLDSNFANPSSILVTVSLTGLAMILIDSYLRKTMHSTVVPFLKISGGIFFGFMNTILVISLAIYVLTAWPFYFIKKPFSEGSSYYAYKMTDIIPKVYETVKIPLNLLTGSPEKEK